MLYPSIFNKNERNFLEDWFDFDFPSIDKQLYGKRSARMMKTDIKENEKDYTLDIELPGFKKEELSVQLLDGNLIIRAEKSVDNDKKDAAGKLVRQERYAGAMERSFYVGDGITEEDVKAKYENGVLQIQIPKKEVEQKEPDKKLIAIE